MIGIKRIAAWSGRLSLRTKLAGGFAAVIALTLVVGIASLANQQRLLTAIDTYLYRDARVAELCLRSNIAMVKARRFEKDFLLKVREFGFWEARSRYATLLRAQLSDIHDNMEMIGQWTDDQEIITQSKEIELTVLKYADGFMRVVELYGQLGRVDTGLESQFRSKAHMIEAILQDNKSEQLMRVLLLARRWEKDFLNRGQEKYAKLAIQEMIKLRADVYLVGFRGDIGDEIAKLSKEYQANLEQYLVVAQRIDTESSVYLAAVYAIEPALENIYIRASTAANKTRDTMQYLTYLTRRLILIAGLSAVMAGLLVAFLISRSITISMQRTMKFADRIAQGNLDTRITSGGGKEFESLSEALHAMADSLQKARLVEERRTAELADANTALAAEVVERKKTTEALRESETRYRSLVEAIPEGIVSANADQIITYCNQPFSSMLGYDHDELVGRKIESLLDKESLNIFRRQWALRHQGIKEPYELSLLKKDGRRIFAIIYPRQLFSETGHFEGAAVLVTDITQRKILESQLLQAQKLESIGQLAAGIAHEINTPTQYVTDNTRFLRDSLSDMLGLIDRCGLLAEQAKGQGLFAEAIADMEELRRQMDLGYLVQEIPTSITQTLEGLERIATIVRSMKEFAHPGPDTMMAVNLNQAIENTVMVARNEWKYVAEVETDLDPDLPLVPCVPGEINQVILNIIVNAAHAIADVVREGVDQKGTIHISTRQVDGQVEIRVADTGSGIPETIRNRVFDPFFTTKEPGKGTGQGLAIAYRVVDKHKGQLSFETEEGKGTTFIIRLLLHEQALERS